MTTKWTSFVTDAACGREILTVFAQLITSCKIPQIVRKKIVIDQAVILVASDGDLQWLLMHPEDLSWGCRDVLNLHALTSTYASTRLIAMQGATHLLPGD